MDRESPDEDGVDDFEKWKQQEERTNTKLSQFPFVFRADYDARFVGLSFVHVFPIYLLLCKTNAETVELNVSAPGKSGWSSKVSTFPSTFCPQTTSKRRQTRNWEE